MIKNIGIVATPNISTGGGFPRVVRDLIASLNELNYKVSLMTPFTLDYEKIKELYGPIKLEKVHYPSGFKKKFCKEDSITRRLMKSEFLKMFNENDLVIDMDGKILDKYLSTEEKKRYIIWRVSCAYSDTKKFPEMRRGLSRKGKEILKDLLNTKSTRPGKDIKIYSLDEWTAKELKYYWNLNSAGFLNPEIQVEHIKYKGQKKKNQIAVLGRIARNKKIHDSIEIFSKGTSKFKDYKLVILGGATPDSDLYIKELSNQIERLNIKERVEMIPNPSFEKIKEILLNSKILIDSQQGVSLTMTAIEAMAAGCIVLATKNGGTYLEVLGKGKYGFGNS